MAKTLAEKRFIKPDMRVAVLDVPDATVRNAIDALPYTVTIEDHLSGQFDQIITYARMKNQLLNDVSALNDALKENRVLWSCYPRGNEKALVQTDLNHDKIHMLLKDFGLIPNHRIAIDDTWSALRFKRSE